MREEAIPVEQASSPAPALTPADLKAQFAAVFAELDARPRPLTLTLEGVDGLSIDLVDGEPVFLVEQASSPARQGSLEFHSEEAGRLLYKVRSRFRRRWLAEHPVPLALHSGMKLKLVPTTGNRVKVRA